MTQVCTNFVLKLTQNWVTYFREGLLFFVGMHVLCCYITQFRFSRVGPRDQLNLASWWRPAHLVTLIYMHPCYPTVSCSNRKGQILKFNSMRVAYSHKFSRPVNVATSRINLRSTSQIRIDRLIYLRKPFIYLILLLLSWNLIIVGSWERLHLMMPEF